MKTSTALGLLASASLCMAAPGTPVDQNETGSNNSTNSTNDGNSQLNVNLGYVTYRGINDGGINQWKGIRYAYPPTGERRWRAPQLVGDKDIEGPVDANESAAHCIHQMRRHTPNPASPQALFVDAPSRELGGQEDCLFLDVVSPSERSSEKLPVIVNLRSRPAPKPEEAFSDQWLVGSSHGNVITVNVQFRSGLYGFLTSEALQADGTANAGLLDQRAALKWVQKYISNFGGDPERITLHGFGVDGNSVVNQMILRGGIDAENAPFHAMIVSHPISLPYHTHEHLEQQYSDILTSANCEDLDCLRQLSEDDLKKAAITATNKQFENDPKGFKSGRYHFGPSVDGEIIRNIPSRELDDWNFVRAPLMVSRVKFHPNNIVDGSNRTTADVRSALKNFFPRGGEGFVEKALELYPEEEFTSPLARQVQIASDILVNCPTSRLVNAMAQAKTPTYKMIFSANRDFVKYGTENVRGTQKSLFETMYDWLLSFAGSRDPNAASVVSETKGPNWPAYTLGNDGSKSEDAGAETMSHAVSMVDKDEITVVEDEDNSARCEFWRRAAPIVRN